MNKSEQNILSFITGLAVGAIAGILLAPEKGKDTQEKLKKQSKKLKGEMGKQLTSLQDKLEEMSKKVASYQNKSEGEATEVKED